MDDFSWFGPALFALIAVIWWSDPLEKTMSPKELTRRGIWLRRLSRSVIFLLVCVLLGTLGDFRKLSQPRGNDPDGGVEIPYSF